MPLSEHEQRLLDEIEQALYAEDPKFASSVRSARTPSRVRRAIVIGTLGILAGLGLILVGLLISARSAQLVFVSVLGFVLLVGSAAFEIQTIRNRRAGAGAATGGGSRPAANGTLRARMEDRMRRRFEEG